MEVYLVDGTYELFRAFFGAPAALGPDGREVGAARALGRSLLSLLRTRGVTHVACAFDHVIESFRNELFDGYKTGQGIPEELFSQFGLAEDVCRALGIVTWPMLEFEADDAIATAAARASDDPQVERVVICSPDKDLAQCVVDARVVCLDRLRDKLLDEPGVIAKFGVPPRAIPDWLALVGDSADGIPGVPRWGAKSAAAVLARYVSLEAIPARADDWDLTLRSKAALAESLAAHREQVALYKVLATLRRDVPLAEAASDLEYLGADRAALGAVCAKLGDRGLLDSARLRG